MKLYYSKGACSLVSRIIINELELDAEFESVDLKNKTTETGVDYLTINRKGSVPALALDNGELLTENAIILQYLADQYKSSLLLPQLGDFNRYRVLEWVNYITTELHKSFSTFFNPLVSDEQKEKVFIPLIKSKLKFVNDTIQDHQYLVADHFTLPDAYLFVMLQWAIYFKFDLNDWNNLCRYHTMLSKRDSIQLSLKQEGFDQA
jgi:glutathione S-transferase